jgi:hypothetical protein
MPPVAPIVWRARSNISIRRIPRTSPGPMPCHLRCLAAVALAVAAPSQCLPTASGTVVQLLPQLPSHPADDEGLSAPIALGFSMPIGGSQYSHVVVESNGVAYLTSGQAPVGNTAFGSADMIGAPGSSPRIAALWDDLAAGTPASRITVDTSTPGVCTIQWIDVREVVANDVFSVAAVLRSSGAVELSSSPGLQVQRPGTIGISAGNGTIAAAADLSTLPTATNPILFEDFYLGAVDISGSTLRFQPVGSGYTLSRTCTSATHDRFGNGCYSQSATFYQYFPAGTFDLGGTGISLIPANGGYFVLPTSNPFVPPSTSATNLQLGNDDEITMALSGQFPYPGGVTNALTVCSNGFVSAGGANGVSQIPEISEHRVASDACWRSWSDYDPTIPGSGPILFEQIGTTAYVTWDAVYAEGTTTAETFQIQFESNGTVHMIWQSVAGARDILVGWSAAGYSADPGGIDLSAAAPQGFAVPGADLEALDLTASPAPISTTTSGTVVSYMVQNIPEFAPGSGLFIGLNLLSLGQTPAPGLDLASLGAPGCVALVASIDLPQVLLGSSSVQTTTFVLPPGVASGTVIYSQAVGLMSPNSLANGQNPAGLVTSNGIASIVLPY